MNGLIEQWGYADQPNDEDKQILFLISYSISLPSVTCISGNISNEQNQWNYPINVYGLSSTKFIITGKSNFSNARFFWKVIGY